MTGALVRSGEDRDTEETLGEGQVRWRKGLEVCCHKARNARDGGNLRVPGRGTEVFSPRALGGSRAFQPPELRQNKVLLF